MIVTQYVVSPSFKRRTLCNDAFTYSWISTIIFIVLSYIIMWVSQDFAKAVDRVENRWNYQIVVLSEKTG